MNDKAAVAVEPYISKFIQVLLSDYGIDQEEQDLINTWREVIKIDMDPKDNKCTFILTRGNKRGERCGCKKTKGSEFCSRHKTLNEKSQLTILKKHISLKKFWDPVTKFVYEDPKNNIVIGKTTKSTKGESCPILQLSEADIELCNKKGLVYTKR